MRNRIEYLMKKGIESDEFSEEEKALFQEWMDNKNDGEKTMEIHSQLVPLLKKNTNPLAAELLSLERYLVKRSIWAFGGDGWAYDIGVGGLDHVLAMGQDINILVLRCV